MSNLQRWYKQRQLRVTILVEVVMTIGNNNTYRGKNDLDSSDDIDRGINE